jgi:putative transposase
LYAPQSLHRRIGLPQGVRALKPNVATADKERVIELEREVREFKRANETLKLASAFFCVGGARPQTQVAYRFVDQYRDRFGVELICKVLPIASSGYYLQAARKANPESLRARANRDAQWTPLIEQVWQANIQVYGADKVWAQLNSQGV